MIYVFVGTYVCMCACTYVCMFARIYAYIYSAKSLRCSTVSVFRRQVAVVKKVLIKLCTHTQKNGYIHYNSFIAFVFIDNVFLTLL